MTYSDFLKNAIIETVIETTDEKLLQYVYTMLMAAGPAISIHATRTGCDATSKHT